MNEKKGKKKNLGKIILTAAVLLAAVITWAVYSLFGSSLSALSTLERIEGTDAYTMEFDGDYGLDQFLQKGAASDEEVVTFISNHFLHGLPLELELPDFGCSAFSAYTPEGDYITARNFDFDDTPILILKTKPEQGYASISTVDLDYLGFGKEFMPSDAGLFDKALLVASIYAPVDGINEKGLSVSVLQIMDGPTVQNTGKPGITTTTAIRAILDRAADVGEAVELLKRYDMHSSANSAFHFLITDAGGKSAVVEYIGEEMVVLDTNRATNYLLAPGEHRDKGEGYDRYDTITESLNESGGEMTEIQAMDVLKNVKLNDESMSTQWSVIFNNTRQTALYSFKADFETTYFYFVNP
ncbi:MAG: linear amide C-N hydrolase [Lacrimispora sp.]|uniref:linear amide C-N hydrolase n=1 Tax=Lacrimispora sp. TaxID=2719234 RepID=UPI0039E508A8